MLELNESVVKILVSFLVKYNDPKDFINCYSTWKITSVKYSFGSLDMNE